MITCPSVEKDAIRSHYDLATPFYRLFWGRHIHHGLWEADEPSAVAAQRLTDTLAVAAAIGTGETVLDVGCGMGGSSIHLAQTLGCHVTGITLSRVQRLWAAAAARWHGVATQASFLRADAEQIQFDRETFDVVWSVECTEHLFDKGAFFRKAADWLKPGGRLAICAWLAGDDSQDVSVQRQVSDVCEAFLCPSLGTWNDYTTWFEQAGLALVCSHDWTSRVTRTWELCDERVKKSGVRGLARLVDRRQKLFLDRFQTILQAYRTGAMRYGTFIARRAS